MLKFTFFLIFAVFGQTLLAEMLPKSALIIEKKPVTADRELILWMPNPTKNPRDTTDDLYTCPDYTRGHYYSGVANVSLLDIKTNNIIQTLEIQGNGITSDGNNIDLPYLIKGGYYYNVPKITAANEEGIPLLLNLKDYNNDGKAHEFALFDALACMGLGTTLIGYSEKQDKVIQYQTELKTDTETFKDYWVDYLFDHSANAQGVWQYEIDYRGRAGSLDKYEIRYDKERELFYGTRVSISDEEK